MKRQHLLAALVVLNVALVLAMLRRLPSPRPWAQTREGLPDAISTGPPASVPPATAGEATANPASGRFSYRQAMSRDLAKYVRNLRAIRCPEPVVADIILAEVNRQFAAREAAARLRRSQRDWWDREAAAATDWERRSTLLDLHREKAAWVKELLGIDLPPDPVPVNPSRTANERMAAALARIPEAKRPAVREAMDRLHVAERQFAERMNGVLLPEDVQEWRKFHAESREKLAQILTAEELAEVELRGSGLETNLKSRLTAFESSPAEFQKLLQLEAEYQPWRTLPGQVAGADGQEAVSAALAGQQQRIEAALGPERFAEYQRAQDPVYRGLSDLLRSQGLAREQVSGSYEVIEQAQRELRSAISAVANDPRQVQTALEIVTQRAEHQLQRILGEEAWRQLGPRLPGLPRPAPSAIKPKP